MFCIKDQIPRPFLLKGLCPLQIEEFNIDTEYYPSGTRNGRTYFRGTQSSHLYYEPGDGDSSDGRTGQWVIISLRDQTYELRLGLKESRKYPFGSHLWELGIDDHLLLLTTSYLMFVRTPV